MKLPFVALFTLALCSPLAGIAAADQAQPEPPAPAASPAQPLGGPLGSYIPMAIDAANSLLQNQLLKMSNYARGEVTYFKRFDLQVRTGQSTYRTVHLHQGTVINPRGTTLTTGQHVTVTGNVRSDGSLEANEITVQ